MFMIPPAYHNPHKSRIQREEMRRDWIRARDNWMQSQLLRLQSMTSTGITIGRATARSQSIAPISGGTSGRTPSLGNGGLIGSQSTPIITQGKVKVMHQGAGRKAEEGRVGLGTSLSAIELERANSRRGSTIMTSSQDPAYPPQTTETAAHSSMRSGNGHSEEEEEDDRSEASGRSGDDAGVGTSRSTHMAPQSDDGDDDDDESGMKAPKRKVSESESSASAEDEASVADSDTSSSLAASSSVYSQNDEDWTQLRDQCVGSWPSSDDPEAEKFWTNYDLNPLTVEAAVCFVDAFPTIFVVPPVQLALGNRCAGCEMIIREEEVMMRDVEKLRSECRQYKDEILSDGQLQVALEQMNTEENRLMALIQQQLLVSRQQTSNMRDNLHFQYIPLTRPFLKKRGPLLRGRGSPSRELSTREGSPSGFNGSTDGSNPFSVFLTAARDEDQMTRTLTRNVDLTVDIESLK